MGIVSGTALWYASRATGVVALVLLTAVVLLGILVNRRGRLPGLPRFATTSLHRSMSLLSVAFIAIHVITAILDPYVTIGIAASVIPFASPYKPLWLGLGAVSLDIMIALILTSLARARIGRRTWRAVHWLAYACWPVAVLHGIGSSTDLRTGWLLALTVGCCVAVAAALAWRIASAVTAPGPAERAAQALAATADGRGRHGQRPRAHRGRCPVSAMTTSRPRAGHAAAPGEPGLPRLLPPAAEIAADDPGVPPGLDLAAHLRRRGLPRYRGGALIEQAAAAGLTGRGGAAFSVARKLAAVAAGGSGSVAVANAAEGEPASSKDAALLWYAPHLVLDGLQRPPRRPAPARPTCACPPGATPATWTWPRTCTRRWPAGRRPGPTGSASRWSRRRRGFLAGEESALVALHQRRRRTARRTKQHRVFERGVGGRPTLVQNVETLAHLALIARYGGGLVPQRRDAPTSPDRCCARSATPTAGCGSSRRRSARR